MTPQETGTIYLAGPMSAESVDGVDVVPAERLMAFDRRASELQAMGFEVINPALLNRVFAGVKRTKLLRADAKLLMRCQTMALLREWRESMGVCRFELPLAIGMGMEIIDAYTLTQIPDLDVLRAVRAAWERFQ